MRRLLQDGAAATLEVDELAHKGIWTLTSVDEGYPQGLVRSLGDQTPPVLFGVGDRTLLSRGGVGIVGSRDIDESGAEVAQDLAKAAVRLGRAVVSGGARGADQLAMNAAYGAGGAVVAVLADSLLARIRKPDTLEALDEGRVCLVTQQAPVAGFSPGAAMGRNKVIYALADLTVVVASDFEAGGTWSGAVEALRNDYGTVVVWRGDGEGQGNEALERLGAIPLKDVAELGSLLEQPQTSPAQMSLDLESQLDEDDSR